MKVHFLRFTLLRKNADSGMADGLFSGAYELAESQNLEKNDRVSLEELLLWFRGHLNVPDKFNTSKSKGSYRRTTRGISWLKSSASEHLDRMRSLAFILEEYGYFSNIISTATPGYIVYEDEHQIVAEPFNDTHNR
jgi:hypothetical protein